MTIDQGDSPTGSKLLLIILIVLAVVGLTTAGYLFLTGFTTPVGGDTPYYLALAQSLAQGRGYVDTGTFWPDVPSMGRAPGWPALLTPALYIFPSIDPLISIRVTTAILHTLSAALIAILTFRITRGHRIASLIAGICYGLNPHGLYLTSGVWSEIGFVFFVLAGLLFFLRGSLTNIAISALLWGFAATIRPNFLVFTAFVAILALLWSPRTAIKTWGTRFITATLIFYLLPALWLARNYSISGKFPLFSTIAGETFYGANNARVANDLAYWGYWVIPDLVPDERPKSELAQSMNEVQLNSYYDHKGKEWVTQHKLEVPRLVLGKLVRAYVPVPWTPSLGTFGAFGFRFVLYLLACLTFRRWRNLLKTPLGVVTIGMFAVNLFTVVVFYGCARFTFTVEPFLYCFVAYGILSAFSGKAEAL